MVFDLVVYDHAHIIFQGKVKAISSENEVGPFDVLALHTNFITVIQNKLVLWFEDKTNRLLPVTRGVLRCYSQQVDIYLGISEPEAIPESHP